jgi:hypothetical protein
VLQRVAALAVIACARLLATLPPKRIRQVLRLLQRGSSPATHEQALRARDTITAVSLRCSGRYCLQRSLATAILCRTGGTWPRWCAGIRGTAPFAAHAWVEADGQPVGESASIAGYRVITSV